MIIQVAVVDQTHSDRSNNTSSIFSSLSGHHRGSGGLQLAAEVPSAGRGAERRAADQAALRPAEGLLQGRSGPRGELPPGPELLQGKTKKQINMNE